jgi:excisionase family DNA binding protein
MTLTRLYTVPEAAEALKVTEAAIRRWIWQRRLAVVKIGSAVRIEEAELARLIEVGRQPGGRPCDRHVRRRARAGPRDRTEADTGPAHGRPRRPVLAWRC